MRNNNSLIEQFQKSAIYSMIQILILILQIKHMNSVRKNYKILILLIIELFIIIIDFILYYTFIYNKFVDFG